MKKSAIDVIYLDFNKMFGGMLISFCKITSKGISSTNKLPALKILLMNHNPHFMININNK